MLGYDSQRSEINLHIDHSPAGCDACLQSLHSKIDPSKLTAGVMLQARRLCRSRRDTAFSPKSTAGSSEAEFNGSPFCVSRVRFWC